MTIKYDLSDLPIGTPFKPGASSVYHNAGLSVRPRFGEFLGVMRDLDADTQATPSFSASARRFHDRNVREFLNSRGFSAEGDYLMRRAHNMTVGDVLKKKPRTKKEKLLRFLVIAAMMGAGIYGFRRLRRWWRKPPNLGHLSPEERKFLSKYTGVDL